MILFLGIRPLKSKEKPLGGLQCPYCGQKDTLTGNLTPHYFHLFWLPIFPVYTSKQASCSHCKRGFFKEEFTPEMEKALL